MKKAATILLLCGLLWGYHGGTMKAAQVTFSDIANSSSKNYIEALAEKNIVSGSNGMFYPKNNITRAQFAKILALSMDLELDRSYANRFTDVPTWAKPYVGGLVKANITTGKSPTRFGSGEFLTKQEMAVLFIRATGLEEFVQNIDFEPNFNDFSIISPYARADVAFAKEIEFISGSNNQFLPKSRATREQVAKLAYLFSFEGHKYYENALNIVIPTFMDEEIDEVTLLDGDESVEVSFTDGQKKTYELVSFLPFLQEAAVYQSFENLDGFDWNEMSSTDKNEIVLFFLDYWKNPYSGYSVLKGDAEAKQLLLKRVNGYYINKDNNRDSLLRTIVWDAVDEKIIEWKN